MHASENSPAYLRCINSVHRFLCHTPKPTIITICRSADFHKAFHIKYTMDGNFDRKFQPLLNLSRFPDSQLITWRTFSYICTMAYYASLPVYSGRTVQVFHLIPFSPRTKKRRKWFRDALSKLIWNLYTHRP